MANNLHTLTLDELKGMLTQSELTAIPRVVLGLVVAPGSSLSSAQEQAVDAWLTEKLTQAGDMVVSAVNECERNPQIKLGVLKVPAATRYTALVIARHAVLSAIPGQSQTLEGGTRAAEYSQAQAALTRIASCELFVDDYGDDPDVVSGGGGVSVIGGDGFECDI